MKNGLFCFIAYLKKKHIVTCFVSLRENLSYDMDKTSISMFEILEPGGGGGGQLCPNTAFEGSQYHSIGVPKFYS